jgi:hypothetical protein
MIGNLPNRKNLIHARESALSKDLSVQKNIFRFTLFKMYIIILRQ